MGVGLGVYEHGHKRYPDDVGIVVYRDGGIKRDGIGTDLFWLIIGYVSYAVFRYSHVLRESFYFLSFIRLPHRSADWLLY